MRDTRAINCMLFMLLAQALTPQPLAAQTPKPSASLTRQMRREVVEIVADRFVRLYVDADTGRMIAEHIRQRSGAGAYDTIHHPLAFAQALTADWGVINDDRHLDVSYQPGAVMPTPGPEGLPTPGGPADTMPDPPELIALWRRTHYGFGRIDLLPGNVGYLEITGFGSGPEGFAIATAALRYLQHADAIIFDLRRMGGGSGDLSNFMISHFTGPDSVLSLRITNRSAGATVDRYTLAKVPGQRRLEVPLYVLTSRETASAGEDFAFVLQNLHRATLVGSRTAGAGHNNAFVDAGHGFVLSISFTRVADPKSGKEWERVGVQPDMSVEPDGALGVAHLAALRKLAVKPGAAPAEKRELELMLEYVTAQHTPHEVPRERLVQYSGRYEGERTVMLRAGRLWYNHKRGLSSYELLPISDTVFAPLPTVRIRFSRGARGQSVIRIQGPPGGELRIQRIGPASGTR
jgi:hypothetical protein